MVKKEDLQFSDPPEIIGRGTFGLVFLGEYRGTQVAVKRVIPPKSKNRGSSGTGSMPMGSAMNSKPSPGVISSNRTDKSSDPGENVTLPEKNKVLASGGSYKAGLRSGSDRSSSGSGSKETKSSGGDVAFGRTGTGISGFLSMIFNTDNATTRRGSVSDATTWKKLRNDFIEEMRYLSKLRHPCVTTVMGMSHPRALRLSKRLRPHPDPL